eukprot:gene16891-23168_t
MASMMMKIGNRVGAMSTMSRSVASVSRPYSLAAPAPAVRAPSRATLNVQAMAAVSAAGTVKITIQGRRLEVTESIKYYVQQKVSNACANQAKELKGVDVTLSVRGGDAGTGKKEQKVQVTIKTVRNGVVRVEDSESTLYAAIDVVCEKVSRKLMKMKEKAITKGKWAGRAGPKGTPEDDAEIEEYLAEVVADSRQFEQEEALRKQFVELNKEFPAAVRRTKVVELDPMTVDEAIDSLEAVGHDFFVFREMESDAMQIVYRRQDEGYGIIIPKARQ